MVSNLFGRWLAHQLDRRDMTAADLARKLEKRPGVVSHWIRGHRIPSPQSCGLIARALDLDEDRVRIEAGHQEEKEPLKPDDPRADLVAMIRRIHWNAEREKIVRAVLEALPRTRKEIEP